MPATGRLLLDVAVVLLAARAGGMLFGRLGQPPVIGELAAGVALGPTVLGAFPGDPSSSLFPAGVQQVLILIGQLGLVLFMFTVGWDLDLKFRLRSAWPSRHTCTRLTSRSRGPASRSGRSRCSSARRSR